MGRSIVVDCSIQIWNDGKIIGSLLTVTYLEDRKISAEISDEQKYLFKAESKKSLKRKGLGADKL